MRLNRTVGSIAIVFVVAVAAGAHAQSEPPTIPHWAAVVHQLALKVHDTGPGSSSTGVFPPVIGQTLPSLDQTGVVETYNLAAPTNTASQSFFSEPGYQRARVCDLPRTAQRMGRERVVDSAPVHFERGHGPDFPGGRWGDLLE